MANRPFTTYYKRIEQNRFDIYNLDVSSFCEDILNNQRLTDDKRLNALLELDTLLYTMLGIDSTAGEKKETKKKSRIIYRAIKKFNKSLGDSFLQHMDPDK